VNKKEAKKLYSFDVTPAVPHTREAEQKFFGSFFQKRTSSIRVRLVRDPANPRLRMPTDRPMWGLQQLGDVRRLVELRHRHADMM
jgi:hypothetical protein